MANLYTGRTAQQLDDITVCEYRFYENSLRNFKELPNMATILGAVQSIADGDGLESESTAHLPETAATDED